MTKDPVCGMDVRPDSPHRFEDETGTHLFCNAGCLAKFRENPERYRQASRVDSHAADHDRPAPKPVTPVAPAAGQEWTCPMHPEIVRDRPGSSPGAGPARGGVGRGGPPGRSRARPPGGALDRGEGRGQGGQGAGVGNAKPPSRGGGKPERPGGGSGRGPGRGTP